ncbi:hypothetical protein ACOME3_001426 [Neoechinorhynchus agilis]
MYINASSANMIDKLQLPPDELKYLVVQDHSCGHSHQLIMEVDPLRRQVWVPDSQEGFVKAHVIEECGEESIIVELELTRAKIQVSVDECQKSNPTKFRKAANMADLTCLNDASVLYNLRERYMDGLIYTYSGLFCVVINPYRRLPIYTDALMQYYKGRRAEDVPPHVFAITDRAYRAMLLDRNDQSILCTGESGAGKTENTKKVIQYLAYVAKSPRSSSDFRLSRSTNTSTADLEQQLLEANPILESFGNARTVKNDNSSRFGKFIRINFDSVGFITAGSIETYLLEKSRTVRQAKSERNFHIFYQLLRSFCPSYAKSQNGAIHSISSSSSDLLLFDQIESYAYLSNGNVELPEADDVEQFVSTINALRIMETTDEQIQSICATLSAVLLIGNLAFVNDKDSGQAIMPDDTIAQKICKLLGINVIDFSRCLLNPKVKCGRELVVRAQDKKQVEFALEAIAKATYEQLFKWILAKINRTLSKATKRRSQYFIGILDIAGFEIFDVNSFEQLCINYTNEKLQQLFNHTMFVLEQREYARENIEWKFTDFGLDLQPTIDLIEKSMGVLSLLDEECVFPNSTDRTYVEKLISAQSSHKNFAKPTVRSKHDFSIFHYAGSVNYCVDQWLVKNTDPINDNIVHLLQNSNQEFVNELWKNTEVITLNNQDTFPPIAAPIKTSIKKGRFRTVGQMYKEQLNSLMSILNRTTPNFIRCIMPNRTKSSQKMEPNLVLSQLRCNGVLEGIRICRHGFPNRIPFQEFRHRYEVLCSAVLPRGFADGRLVCEKLLQELELDTNLYRIGQTKIFFRAGVLAHLEEERDQKISDIVMHLQCLCRGKIARNQYKKRTQQVSSILVLQRNGRVLLQIRHWKWFKLYSRLKPMLGVTRLDKLLVAKEREISSSKTLIQRLYDESDELRSRIDHLTAERNVALEELSQEREANQELADSRTRLLSRKAELEKYIQKVEARVMEDDVKAADWVEERKDLQQTIKDLTGRLGEEERKNQKMEIEKVVVEGRAKKAEEELVDKVAHLDKYSKAKEASDKRLNEAELEQRKLQDKVRELAKQNAKFEIIVVDIEAKLKSESEQRQKYETIARSLDRELIEHRDLLNESRQDIEESKILIAKKDRELGLSNAKLEEIMTLLSSRQREIRDIKGQLTDIQEDLKSEQDARMKAEADRRDLSEENEALRNEITGHSDTTATMQVQYSKREAEYNELKRKLESEQEVRVEAVQAVKVRFTEQLKRMTDEMDQLQRLNQNLQKEKNELIERATERDDELLKAKNARDTFRSKLKIVETELHVNLEALNEVEQQKLLRENELSQVRRTAERAQAAQAAAETKLVEIQNCLQSCREQLEDTKSRLHDELDSRSVLENRNRLLESEIDSISELHADKCEEYSKLEMKCQSLGNALNEVRIQGQAEYEMKLDEHKRGFQRERENLISQIQDLSDQLSRATASRNKLQNELADVSVEMERYRSNCNALEKSQKQIDRKLLDEKVLQEKLRSDLENAERECREKETRLLSFQYDLQDRDDTLKQAETKIKQLRSELDDALSGKDDVGRSVCGLERAKRTLESTCEELRQKVSQLEDDLSNAETAKLRLEVNMNALKQQLERQVAEANENSDDRYRTALKQVRDMATELDEERKMKSIAISHQKKLELDISDASAQLSDLMRVREDQQRQIKRAAMALKDLKRELEEARATKDDITKEWEKRYCSLEQLLQQTQDERDEIEKSKRTLASELDDFRQEVSIARNDELNGRWHDEKRRLEARVTELEEDLAEESIQTSELSERLRALVQQHDQLINDLNQERLNVNKAEMSKETSERALRELKQKLADAEEVYRNRNKLTISSLESKLSSLEQQLDVEQKERQRLARALRCSEKKLRELTLKCEDEKNAATNAREQVENVASRVRQLKKVNDDHEENASILKGKIRKLQREKEALEGVLSFREQKIRQMETVRSSASVSSMRVTSSNLRNLVSGTPISSGGDLDMFDAEDDDESVSSNTGSSMSTNHLLGHHQYVSLFASRATHNSSAFQSGATSSSRYMNLLPSRDASTITALSPATAAAAISGNQSLVVNEQSSNGENEKKMEEGQ